MKKNKEKNRNKENPKSKSAGQSSAKGPETLKPALEEKTAPPRSHGNNPKDPSVKGTAKGAGGEPQEKAPTQKHAPAAVTERAPMTAKPEETAAQAAAQSAPDAAPQIVRVPNLVIAAVTRLFSKKKAAKATDAPDAAGDPAQAKEKKERKPKVHKPEEKFGISAELKKAVLARNPVFIRFAAAVPVLGAATTLKNGVMISCVMLLTLVLLNLLLIPVFRFVPEQFRSAVSFIAAGAAVTPVALLASYLVPAIASGCGFYLPLVAVGALLVCEKKYFGKRHGLVKTAAAAAMNGLGFAVAAVLFAVLRESIGYGTLYERPLPYLAQMKFIFVLLPAGGLILLAVLTALFTKIFGVKDTGGEDLK